jgi:hypothetical protein
MRFYETGVRAEAIAKPSITAEIGLAIGAAKNPRR